MADPLWEECLKYNVGGLVPYDESRAQYYLVEIIGKKERIPLRFNLKDGAREVETCMKARYGSTYLTEFNALLKEQILNCEEDFDIWGPWRAEYAVISVLRVAELPY